MHPKFQKSVNMVKKLWKSIIDLIKGGILYILTGSVLANAITMISSVVIARLIDKAEYAALAYADNFYGYITLASGLGLSTAMLKFAAVSDSPKERSKYFNYSFVCGGTFNLSLSLLHISNCLLKMLKNIFIYYAYIQCFRIY